MDLRAGVAALGAGMVGTGVSLGDHGAKRRSGAGEEELFARRGIRGRRKKGKSVFVQQYLLLLVSFRRCNQILFLEVLGGCLRN